MLDLHIEADNLMAHFIGKKENIHAWIHTLLNNYFEIMKP